MDSSTVIIDKKFIEWVVWEHLGYVEYQRVMQLYQPILLFIYMFINRMLFMYTFRNKVLFVLVIKL